MPKTRVTREQKRACLVLERLQQLCREDNEVAVEVAEKLDDFLDLVAERDTFGTEGQNDPRGDMRDESWAMDNVQGIDG